MSRASVATDQELYRKKYSLLKKKCSEIQEGNEKLVNRLHHVRLLLRKQKRVRKALIARLDSYSDPFREVQVPVFWEENDVYRTLIANPKGPPAKLIRGQSISASFTGLTASGQGSLGAGSVGPFPGMEPSVLAALAEPPQPKPPKKKRDPNAPKKPINAYFMFCRENRNEVQDAFFADSKKEISRMELTRRLAQKWNLLTSEQKKFYYDRYEQAKHKYDLEMHEYQRKLQEKNATVSLATPTPGTPSARGMLPASSVAASQEGRKEGTSGPGATAAPGGHSSAR